MVFTSGLHDIAVSGYRGLGEKSVHALAGRDPQVQSLPVQKSSMR